jgi:hypothetical protein
VYFISLSVSKTNLNSSKEFHHISRNSAAVEMEQMANGKSPKSIDMSDPKIPQTI